MPLIHFAFSGHYRSGDYDGQLSAFLEHILLPRKLRAFSCPEFEPIINNPNALVADPNSARSTGDGGVTFDSYVPAPPVHLLQQNVWMISFVDIPLKKLRRWEPVQHYGRLGIAITDDFRRRNHVRRVTYYQYPNLAQDPLVIQLNRGITEQNAADRKRLWEAVVQYRKPAKLWKEINNLFAALKLTVELDRKVAIEKLTYSRYEVGYDFESECEARLVTTEEDRDINFNESDVLAIIVPDNKMKIAVKSQLEEHWSTDSNVIVYPE